MTTFFMITFGLGCIYCMYEYLNLEEHSEVQLEMVRRQTYKEGYIDGLSENLIESGSKEFDIDGLEPDIMDGVDYSFVNRIFRK